VYETRHHSVMSVVWDTTQLGQVLFVRGSERKSMIVTWWWV